MRFLFFLFGLVLAGCILSCWTYVEKYLEFFPSLPWCVCLQLNVIFSTNMWPVLTKLFPASVCWAVKNVKFSEQHLSEPDFWVFLKQRISVWWKYTRTDTLWNLIFFFLQMRFLHSHPKTWNQSFPHDQYFSGAHQRVSAGSSSPQLLAGEGTTVLRWASSCLRWLASWDAPSGKTELPAFLL